MEDLPVNFEDLKTIYDIYKNYWLPFGEILTDIEREGIKVNKEQLIESKIKAEIQVNELKNKVIGSVLKLQPDCIEFNPSSTQQMQQLLFAPFKRDKTKNKTSKNENPIENIEEDKEEIDPMVQERNFTVIDEFPLVRSFKVEKIPNHDYKEDEKKKKLKTREMEITGLGLPVVNFSLSGLPSVDTGSIKALADGVAKEFFVKNKEPEKGEIVDEMLNNLLKLRSTETLLNTFIVSLIEQIDLSGRVHCSLNINTETGRLSSRKPNLQNQPALEKDVFKTRLAFEAEKGKKLLIADYGQLELRILAHITNCKSMIEAFERGGDFHSRTAAGMFEDIKKELAEGKLRLEKGDNESENIPLLKDKYANERKKAKTMNFSVAYGKTAFGFAKDWQCSLEEAEKFLELWYSERPEVKEWQEKTKKTAIEYGFTKTLMGRYRILTKHFTEKNKMRILHGLRAAINTPIQGGAADVVIAAMVKINKNKWLKQNGWKIIHQIHDEVILEGPEETAEKALSILIKLMEDPLKDKLRVKLEVDAKICNNWFDAK